MVDLDNKLIPDDIDYDKIHNLASEAKKNQSCLFVLAHGCVTIKSSTVHPKSFDIVNKC